MDISITVFIVSTVVKIALVVAVLLGIVAYTVLAERKICAAIQDRVGPNRVGLPFLKSHLWGLGQPIADAFKLMLKEQFVPGVVKKFYYSLAPFFVIVPPLIIIGFIPFASIDPVTISSLKIVIPQPGVIINAGTGVLWAFAISSLSVYGIVLAGWASNSKYAFLGGIRSTAQMISYEVALGFSIIPVFLLTGSLNFSEIVKYQIEHGWLLFPFLGKHPDLRLFVFWPFLFISFLIFMVSLFAETNRAPFDLPESEQELVAGYNTEYGGMKFGMFFLGEYAAMIAASSLIITLFLGGWSLPLGFLSEGKSLGIILLQALVFLLKILVFLFLFIWIRWTLPRFRYDQLMNLGWKIFLPLATVNIGCVAILLALIKTP
ncbi:complex I subunit 1/NuoH family protein [Methylacidiphilum caldifontis]|uniref:NADH-quinone oxidoreductase subunit H n=1 Tax=Methylacidiphilum caldifontis TaxID=2795386 RepID=A0A4Y8PBS6_9BACT|nr:complex I subunit 1 family protein [Methylacidiphilum caldifontis]QSR88190.1 NADH-quinone oxidoreductase subunit H [Methylacidiphilum caldifontis]TFE68228.1 hydroxyacid dehydrogenase [Methylacidiphilum caldifontis]